MKLKRADLELKKCMHEEFKERVLKSEPPCFDVVCRDRNKIWYDFVVCNNVETLQIYSKYFLFQVILVPGKKTSWSTVVYC